MAYIRKKKIKGNIYYYAVEGKYENNKIKQKVIRYLGTIETILDKFKFWDKKH